MTTPTFIMAVPWWPQRTKAAVELMRQTGGTIVWDEQHSIMDTWRKTMRAIGDGPGICLEDDVILTDRWRDKTEAAIAGKPDNVIQFFTLGNRKRSGFVKGHLYMSTCAYYLPAGYAPQLLEYAEGWEERPEHKHINKRMGCDIAIAHFLRDRDESFWHEVPSLVQHRDWQSMVDPKRTPDRVAENFNG